jgi:inosine-uridine nucleoside N-ribohydrolase
MAKKAILVMDPGIDGAFAAALALLDPDVDVLGLIASPGNVTGQQATRNIHILVEQIDPPRWPRLGAAPAVEYEIDGTRLHGANGLGGIEFPCAQLHHPHPGDKLLSDLVRQHPKEVTVLLLGPATVFARAIDRDPELPGLVERLIVLGGAWHDPGDIGPVTEFHFACDALAARQVLRSGCPVTLLPLDVSRKIVLSPTDLLNLPNPDGPAVRFLRRIVPQGFSATASLYGTEGFYLQDVAGIVALSQPGALTTKPVVADVETRGELTRGMSVIDVRWACTARPNVELATSLESHAARQYILRTFAGGGSGGHE